MFKRALSLVLTLAFPVILSAQNRIGTGLVAESYKMYCATCHGENLTGGLGQNLVDDVWVYGDSIADISKVIREGVIDKGMIPYASVMSDEEIQAMAIYIKEMGQLAKAGEGIGPKESEGGVFQSDHHAYKLEKLAGLENGIFWSVGFLPDGGMLLSQFDGALYVYRDGELGDPITGIPEITINGQGGLMEVQPHPEYEKNGWIYLSYAEKSFPNGDDKAHFMTAIVRGRIKNGKWVDQQDIFRVPQEFHRTAGVHYGTRFVFKDGYLFFSIGDRGAMEMAQDLTRPNGKVHRIHDDGRIPQDNPFVAQLEAYPSIWSYGNRNPQGLDMDPATGLLWETEHGPRGGDELNIIRKGRNYGWPVITYGMNYNGQPISGKTAQEGMEQPVHYWTPSIAVCGIDFYEGKNFPKWTGDLFVAGLASNHLERFKIVGETIVEHEVVVKGQGRVRDVSTGPDGNLYVILNTDRRAGPGGVYRLSPAD